MWHISYLSQYVCRTPWRITGYIRRSRHQQPTVVSCTHLQSEKQLYHAMRTMEITERSPKPDMYAERKDIKQNGRQEEKRLTKGNVWTAEQIWKQLAIMATTFNRKAWPIMTANAWDRHDKWGIEFTQYHQIQTDPVSSLSRHFLCDSTPFFLQANNILTMWTIYEYIVCC